MSIVTAAALFLDLVLVKFLFAAMGSAAEALSTGSSDEQPHQSAALNLSALLVFSFRPDVANYDSLSCVFL
ncbi:hypothetical protein B0H13DRAFT_423073 [Mycena leptocephala]|nr:hypothetical protein B0H13DRAFT_423073 [Mycena leptocephala]